VARPVSVEGLSTGVATTVVAVERARYLSKKRMSTAWT